MDIYHTFGIQVPRVYSYQVMCICSSFVGKSWQCRCFPRKQLEKCWRCCFVRSFVLHQIWMIWISRVQGCRVSRGFVQGRCVFVHVFYLELNTNTLGKLDSRAKNLRKVGNSPEKYGKCPRSPQHAEKTFRLWELLQYRKICLEYSFQKKIQPLKRRV